MCSAVVGEKNVSCRKMKDFVHTLSVLCRLRVDVLSSCRSGTRITSFHGHRPDTKSLPVLWSVPPACWILKICGCSQGLVSALCIGVSSYEKEASTRYTFTLRTSGYAACWMLVHLLLYGTQSSCSLLGWTDNVRLQVRRVPGEEIFYYLKLYCHLSCWNLLQHNQPTLKWRTASGSGGSRRWQLPPSLFGDRITNPPIVLQLRVSEFFIVVFIFFSHHSSSILNS